MEGHHKEEPLPGQLMKLLEDFLQPAPLGEMEKLFRNEDPRCSSNQSQHTQEDIQEDHYPRMRFQHLRENLLQKSPGHFPVEDHMKGEKS